MRDPWRPAVLVVQAVVWIPLLVCWIVLYAAGAILEYVWRKHGDWLR